MIGNDNIDTQVQTHSTKSSNDRMNLLSNDALCLPDLELRSPTKKKSLNLKNKWMKSQRSDRKTINESSSAASCLSKNYSIVLACLNLILCLAILVAAIFYLRFYQEFQSLKLGLQFSNILNNQQLEEIEISAVLNEKDQDRRNLNSAAEILKLRQIIHELGLKIGDLNKSNMKFRKELSGLNSSIAECLASCFKNKNSTLLMLKHRDNDDDDQKSQDLKNMRVENGDLEKHSLKSLALDLEKLEDQQNRDDQFLTAHDSSYVKPQQHDHVTFEPPFIDSSPSRTLANGGGGGGKKLSPPPSAGGSSENFSDRVSHAQSIPLIDESIETRLNQDAKTARNRKLKNYYARQLNLVEQFKEDSEYLRELNAGATSREFIVDSKQDNPKDGSSLKRWEMILTRLTLLINLILFFVKLLAAVLSGSLVVVSSVVDSAMDLTTGLVMFFTTRAIKKRNILKYPRGRTRLEPLALIVISVIMGAANVQVVVQSLESILSATVNPHVDTATLVIMCATVGCKIFLAIICYVKGKESANVRVLMQDHRNDCISNSVAIVCAFVATHVWKYLDPIAAVLVSFYIIGTWVRTGFHHVAILSGKTATPEVINRIVKVCIDHRPKVLSVDTIYAYHFGLKYLVEVHVVLDENITLKEAHDISEPLQRKIEHLPYVERAFVHVDYDTSHKPESEHKVV